MSIVGHLMGARYALSNALLGLTVFGVLVGGWMLVLALVATIASSIADEAIGDESLSVPNWKSSFCNANLYAAVPLLCLLSVSHSLLAARVAAQLGVTSIDLLVQFSMATLLVGYQYALVGATVGHELVHRAKNRVAMFCSCLLLAFTFNTGFTIFHVLGHHRLVGLWQDPACARRGEAWAAFLLRTMLGQARLAYRFEAERLKPAHAPLLCNRFLSRQLFSVAIAATTFLLGGAAALMAFFCAAFIGRCLHELVNYVQHYGLVRAPGHRAASRHTWDCNRLISNALQYNLPRHSAHHLFARKPFWALGHEGDAPILPYGYQTMAAIALIPPLWRRIMKPLLNEWDARYASEAERAIVRQRGWA